MARDGTLWPKKFECDFFQLFWRKGNDQRLKIDDGHIHMLAESKCV